MAVAALSQNQTRAVIKPFSDTGKFRHNALQRVRSVWFWDVDITTHHLKTRV